MAVTEDMISSAKEVEIGLILDEFDWEIHKYNYILCPNIDHDDTHPGVYVKSGTNKCRCFVCNKSFDTISMYQALMEKVRGRQVSFPQAVEDILELDGQIINRDWNRKMEPISYQRNSNASLDKYKSCLSRSKRITGYELTYLKKRGIFIYDSIVYEKEVYDVRQLEKELETETDPIKQQELKKIFTEGKRYNGISDILKKNFIQIRHLWDAEHRNNHILYHIEHEINDMEIEFLSDYDREMIIQKSIDGGKFKCALGETDFCFITEGLGEDSVRVSKIYLCEGIEDALSFAQNGHKAISLNSVSNLHSLMDFLSWDNRTFRQTHEFIIAFDHDDAGEKATRELIDFFEEDKLTARVPIKYNVCNFPKEFKDINEYWISRVYE